MGAAGMSGHAVLRRCTPRAIPFLSFPRVVAAALTSRASDTLDRYERARSCSERRPCGRRLHTELTGPSRLGCGSTAPPRATEPQRAWVSLNFVGRKVHRVANSETGMHMQCRSTVVRITE